MKTKYSSKSLAKIGMVAAIYVALCLLFAPVSYGVIQFRIAEALVLLAVFSVDMVTAVTIGCAIANSIGFMMGLNPVIDIFFGTAATLIAAIISYKLRNVRLKGYPLAASLPPVIINGIVIGAELTLLETNSLFASLKLFTINAFYIALSEIIPCCIIGVILVVALEKTKVAEYFK